MVVDYLSSQPNRAGYQVSTKQGSGPWSGVSGTGDGKSDFRGTADGVSNEVSSRLHSTGPWWV